MSALLAGRDLGLYRGERLLFEHLHFALRAGELLLVEGPNGSGKTSLLRAIGGLLSLDEGSIHWRGRLIQRDRQAFHADLAWMGHRVGCKGDLSPLENLRFESGLQTMTMAKIEEVFAKLGLAERAAMPFRLLSAGQQRRVALARLRLTRAALWIMDEPFSNLDTAGQQLAIRLIEDHLAAGGSAVVASHHALPLEAVVHRIALR